jgi:hypothetical protein
MSGRRRWSLTDIPEWGRQQMSLNDTILSSVVRVIGDKHDSAYPGSVRGVIGTGFLCAIPSRLVPNARYTYVVTAHHVIEDQNDSVEVQAPFPNSMGSELQDPVEVSGWTQPLDGVDLAIADFYAVVDGTYGGLASEFHFFPEGGYPPLGGVVHYVGILEPEDRVMVRSGTLGALFQSGLDHEGGYVYDAHLLDCRSYSGFSGSPCFIEIPMAVLESTDTEFPGDKRDPSRRIPARGPIQYNALLGGMITWHLAHRRQEHASLYGVVAAVTSNDIWRALMTEKEQQERDDADRKYRKYLAEKEKGDEAKPTNLAASGEGSESEFERFKDLTRHLVNTPKQTKEDGS